MHKMRPFFVYGTLKPGEENYPRYFGGRTLAEQPAILRPAALYTDGRYPFLVLDSSLIESTDYVSGMLITIRPGHYPTVLRAVDGLEAYEPGSSTNWYERVICTVECPHGYRDAWVYIAATRMTNTIRRRRMVKLPEGTWSRTRSRLESYACD